MLRNLSRKALIHLTLLFNLLLQLGHFSTWKAAKVNPIPKPNTDPNSLRPISLLSTLGKLFERILAVRLTPKNSVALVRERTIPTERPPPVGEVSANFCG